VISCTAFFSHATKLAAQRKVASLRKVVISDYG
jgi:hypothetical protein